MKLFKILSHPYTLIFSFLFILISGRHLGGFYALYVLLGLPSGVLHSVLGFLGVLLLGLNYRLVGGGKPFIKQTLNIVGIGFFFLSLFYFFERDKEHYNWGTFELVLPLFTLIFTAFIGLCFIVGNFWQPSSGERETRSVLSKV